MMVGFHDSSRRTTQCGRAGRVLLGGVAAIVALGACGTRVERAGTTEGVPASQHVAQSSPEASVPAVDSTGPASPSMPASAASGQSGSAAATSSAAAGPGSAVAGSPARSTSPSPGASASSNAASPSSNAASPARSGARKAPAPTPGQGAAPTPAAGAKSEVVLASVGNYSGPAGSVFVPVIKAAQVWVKSVNARGGLNGHPVRLLTQDDGADPSRNKAIVKELVERQGVIAFLGNYDVISGNGSYEYLMSKRIPVVGGILPDRRFGESPMFFPEGAAFSMFNLATVAAVAEVALPQKTKAGIIVCAEAQACKEAGPDYAKFAPTVGFQVVYNASASLAQPDYTAECLAARNAGAEVIFVGLDGNSIRRLAASCARQAYRPLLTIPATAIQPGFSTDNNMDGFVGASAVYPWFLQDARSAEYFAAKQKFAADMVDSGITMEAWTNGKMMEAAAASLPDQPTSQSILEGLWAIRDNDLGGLTQPLTFQRDKANPQRACWFTVKVDKGQWVAPNGDKLSCK